MRIKETEEERQTNRVGGIRNRESRLEEGTERVGWKKEQREGEE